MIFYIYIVLIIDKAEIDFKYFMIGENYSSKSYTNYFIRKFIVFRFRNECFK